MVKSRLVLRSYFSLRITGLNVKQLLMVEAKSSTSQASCKAGQAGGRKAGGSGPSSHTALLSRIDFQALRTDSALCRGATPRYWHANVASPSWAAREETERSPPRSFRKASALGSQTHGSLKKFIGANSDHSQTMSCGESQQFFGAKVWRSFHICTPSLWCEHFAMCNAWI